MDEIGMKLSALCVLNAVNWPGAAVLREVFGLGWMPLVTALKHWLAALEEFGDQFIERAQSLRLRGQLPRLRQDKNHFVHQQQSVPASFRLP